MIESLIPEKENLNRYQQNVQPRDILTEGAIGAPPTVGTHPDKNIPSIDIKLETVTVTGGTISTMPNKKKAKHQYKKALELFVDGHHKKAFKLLNKAILNDPKTKKYFLQGDLENIFI